MIHVDGGQKSGSGTIVRYAVGLAALLGKELQLTNIRSKRDKPGLKPQHLTATQPLLPEAIFRGAPRAGTAIEEFWGRRLSWAEFAKLGRVTFKVA
jgi:RNA 3'-terminal phosphate cyclase (ATP)